MPVQLTCWIYSKSAPNWQSSASHPLCPYPHLVSRLSCPRAAVNLHRTLAGPLGSEAEAEVQPAPEDASVPVVPIVPRIAELVVVRHLRPYREPARQVDVEGELRPGHQPVLQAVAVDAAEVGAEAGAHYAEVRCQVEAQHGPSRQAVVVGVEGPEHALLERQAAEEPWKGVEHELGADQVAIGAALVLLPEVVPVDRAQRKGEALRP